MNRLGRRALVSALLASLVALVGMGPVAFDAGRSVRTPPLDSLALPALGRPIPASAPAVEGVPPATSASRALSGRNESVIKAAPSRFQGAAPKAVAPPAALTKVSSQSVRQPGTWAVVIGVNDYPGTNDDLRSAVNDANDAAQALSQMGVAADRMISLRDGQVTSRTVLSAVDWLAANAAPEAVAVFFYAGHVRKASKTTEEMVLSDGSAVTDATLARALSKVSAARSWVAIAACFGGGFTEVLVPGRVLTGAAAADELAYENDAINRSYMVEYMIRRAMILEHAPETVQSAFEYAVVKLREDHPNREPVEFDNGDGRLSLRPPGMATPPRKTDQPAPGAGSGNGDAPPPQEPPPSREPNCTNTGVVRYCRN